MTQRTIAVVEDDEDLLANVCSYLRQSGFLTWGATSAESFYVRLLRERIDLAVVDLGLPGETGLSLVRRLAAERVPVIIQTARGQLEQRIAGLEAGALQYFVKPTDMGELVAGINAQLRHLSAPAPRAGELTRWRLDVPAALLIAPDQRSVRLTSRELDLMICLMETPGSMVDKAALLRALGHGDVEGGFHRIETLLSRLRRKTLEATGVSLPVRAIFGRGLVFVV